LYIATEDLPGIRQRVRAWRQYHRTMTGSLDILEMPSGIDLAAPTHVDDLLAAMAGIEYSLITLDTLREAHTGDENSSTDMARVNRAIQRIIRETGAAVEVLHHTGVNDGRERGSTALSANCDLKWRVSNDDGVIAVTCEKFRHGATLEPRYCQLSEVAGSAVAVATDARQALTPKLGKNEREILEFLALDVFADIGAKQAQIKTGTTVPERSIYRVLSSLKRRDYVRQGAKGDPYQLTVAGRTAIAPRVQLSPPASENTAVQSPTATTAKPLPNENGSPLPTAATATTLRVAVAAVVAVQLAAKQDILQSPDLMPIRRRSRRARRPSTLPTAATDMPPATGAASKYTARCAAPTLTRCWRN